MAINIRKIESRDKRRWRQLWMRTPAFMKGSHAKPSARTWSRIMDPTIPVYSIVAEGGNKDGVLGMANYIVHESTSNPAPVCYLQDLFVDPSRRGAGVGRS